MVVVLSDEQDGCLRQASIEALLASFTKLKKHQQGGNKKLVWNSMLSPDPRQHGGYKQLSQATGGRLGNLTQPYAPQLSAMGAQIKNLVRSVDLDCEPLPVYDAGQKIKIYTLSDQGVRAPASTNVASCSAACAGVAECVESCKWLDYQVQGRQILLGGPLPTGRYEVQYYCARR